MAPPKPPVPTALQDIQMFLKPDVELEYSVVLNKRAARLLIFEKFSYLHALIRYLHVY